ncbi:hypothetical protein SRHO_G00075320 [Serrasalmus rhombeus]
MLKAINDIKGEIQSHSQRIGETEERISQTEDDSEHTGSGRLTPRVVIIKFVNWRDRETVLKAARKTTDLRYENHRVSFFPDLSAETRKLQRNFDDVKARFRALGVRYGMLYPAHLIITHNDKRRIFKSVTEAEKYIQEISPHSGATRGYAAYAAHMGAALEGRQTMPQNYL